MENLFLQNIDGYFACQNEEDASLIAAAPELLALAQQHEAFWAQRMQELGCLSDDAMAVRAANLAAIAKATGAAA